MPIITTKSFVEKPVTPLDWTGAPMKPGQSYAGTDAPQTPVKPPVARPDAPAESTPRTRRRRTGTPQTPAQRQAFGDRMRAYWAKKRCLPTSPGIEPDAPPPVSPSVEGATDTPYPTDLTH